MNRIKKIAVLFAVLATGLPTFAKEVEGQGMSAMAEPLFRVGPLPITNSMVMTWAVALGLVILIRFAVGKPRLVPTRGQAVVENVIVSIRDVVGPIVGPKAIGASFPLLIALFTYILIENWSGLIPGVGTILMRSHADGHWMELFRPSDADMNATFALAAISITAWLYIILRYAGPKAVLFDLFGNKANKDEVPAIIYYPLIPIFMFVGLLELVSIAFRPVSLSFRLYGNIFGGENLLHSMSAISRWGLPMPFYFMELLVGLVQAFVFALLIAVYIGLICNHGDDHHGATH
jgi:F-type H+-transporting ATPase subunit a